MPRIFKGLGIGDQVTVAGSASNNSTFTITAISSDQSQITVSETVTTETDTNGTTISGVANSGSNGYTYTAGTQLVMTNVGGASTDTIQVQDSGGTAVAGVFSNLAVGQTFTTSGLANAANNATFTISAISGDGSQITVTEDVIVTETDTNGANIQVFAADGTVAATPYFTGDQLSLTHRVSDRREFEFNLTAADPAFEKAIRGMFLIMQGKFGQEGGLDMNLARIGQAQALIEGSLERTVTNNAPFGTAEQTGSIEQIQRDVGFNKSLLDTTDKLHETFIGFIDGAIGEAEDVEQLDVVTRLLDSTRALEASFQAFARIRQLSLTNFI